MQGKLASPPLQRDLSSSEIPWIMEDLIPLKSDYILWPATSLLVLLGARRLVKYFLQKQISKLSTPEVDAAILLEERKPSNLWNTALFFPDYYCGRPDSDTQQFLWYFAQARTSIRVCIYNFSFPELQSVLSQKYEKGLIVQFVVGHENTAEHLRLLSLPCGLVPRKPGVLSTDQLMHHKFAVIDDEAVLVGSMNWTTEGIFNNEENINVSTNPRHVQKYLGEYFTLMKICEDARTFY